jgi:transposase-like protein
MIKDEATITKKNKKKNIIMKKARLTREIRDLDMRYVKITCLSCVLDNEVRIIK